MARDIADYEQENPNARQQNDECGSLAHSGKSVR